VLVCGMASSIALIAAVCRQRGIRSVGAARFVFLAVTLPLAGGASSGCPCLVTFPTGIDPTSGISIGGQSYAYPASYGLASCAAHDEGLQPACSATANRPAWCADVWCYVDRNNCDLPATTSSYFPGTTLHFSYNTCGGTNTFSTWFSSEHSSGDDPTSGEANQPPSPPPHQVGDIVSVIHDYLISLSNTLEDNEPEIRGLASCASPAPSSCPCATCRRDTEMAAFWTNETYTLATWNATGTQTAPLLSFDFSTVSLTPRGSPTSPDGIVETCLSGYLENAFLRVAAREASITDRIGYEYAAFQALGNYVQWPATQWCPANYDPRFRSWYVSAASGPKDVVIVLDVSGSMRQNDRMNIMQTAALRLLDTFTDVDYVSLVSFSSTASVALGDGALHRATDGRRSELKAWVRSLQASGTTNFETAFSRAFDLLESSHGTADGTSSCTKAILFLSDGIPDAWDGSDTARVRERAQGLGGVQIFTYALGTGAQTTTLKGIACQNEGAMWQVGDGGNLADAMADYYTFLAPLQGSCQVRWTYYNDWSSGAPLLSACLATFKKQAATDPTSCAEGAQGCMPDMLGVACMDVSVIASQRMIDARPDAQTFYERVRADQTACNRRAASPAQLQALRARIDDAFGDAVCTADEMGLDSAPEPAACTNGSASAPPTASVAGAEGEAAGGVIGGIIAAAVVLVLVVSLVAFRLASTRKTDASGAQSVVRPTAAAVPSASTASAVASQPYIGGYPQPQHPASVPVVQAVAIGQPACVNDSASSAYPSQVAMGMPVR